MALASSCWSCGGGGTSRASSARDALQSAARATAQARSFTLSLAGVEVTYQSPDRVQQVEHGQGSSASASNRGGPPSSAGPFAVTITKIFIGDRHYEADSAGGDPRSFTVAARCANEGNVAEYVLRVLRAMTRSSYVGRSGDRYTFRLAQEATPGMPRGGIATILNGFVQSLNLESAAVTIGSVNRAPPVSAPSSSTPTNVTCN